MYEHIRFDETSLRDLTRSLDIFKEAALSMFAFKQIASNSCKPIHSEKFHLILHLPMWIKLYGSPLGFDTERWESFLTLSAKRIWKRSQKSKGDFANLMFDKLIELRSSYTKQNNHIYSEKVLDFAVPVLTRSEIESGKNYSFAAMRTGRPIKLIVKFDDGMPFIGCEGDWALSDVLSDVQFSDAIQRYMVAVDVNWDEWLRNMANGSNSASLISALSASVTVNESHLMKLYSRISRPMVNFYVCFLNI